ncbi:hypothetical protein F3157_10170 [Virgibacillus dakarensis]|uniref:PTS cellobiose transporter subunit IIA n=1 Tax=Lentibacillus populi TaxID=1827502 RepID=A0A9W5U179_9BACI|nr:MULTISPECIES: hypothetical protein [Bacillaceae]MBT2215546.1 hypothetical protein [Virgibacillus dakarensis]MTW86020.1 hypothetical protein [Virgibacillus dakarensis]GGB56415.1 hypothetical protein GCM10011409_37520 [Lentibacillus populi]
MKSDERARIEQNRKEFSIKSMYFNRFLLVRYVSALFFFTNLYWFISMLMSDSSLFVIPLILMIVLLFSIAEQVKMYGKHTNNAKYTKYCFMILLSTNVILIVTTCFSSSFTQLYPFLLNQDKSKILVLTILIVGILLSVFILYRLIQIKHNKDKHYQRIKKYEEVIN